MSRSICRKPLRCRSRQLRYEAVEALQLERITIELVEKDRVVEHTCHLSGRRSRRDGRPIRFLARPRVRVDLR